LPYCVNFTLFFHFFKINIIYEEFPYGRRKQMRLTEFFLPTLRDDPQDAEIESHKLMLKAGLIRKVAAGVYSYLPFGLIALKKVEAIVREEMNKAGALELLFPAIMPRELWDETEDGIYMAMKCVKHLVPVGFTPEVLVGSIRRFPVDGVILVRGKDRSLPNAEKAEEAARSVREALGSVPVRIFVDVDDIEGAALSLVGRIIAERASGCVGFGEFSSGSIRSLGVAAYLAALSSGAPAYIGLPDYKGHEARN